MAQGAAGPGANEEFLGSDMAAIWRREVPSHLKPETSMNTILIQGDWNILKGKLKQAWALLMGDDMKYETGKTVEFLGRIQKKTGEKRAAIEKTMRECEELRQQIGWC